MRSLDDARAAWETLRQYDSIQDLRVAVRLDGQDSIATAGGRSACWKVFLLFEDLDASSWIRTLSSTRSAYNSLRTHFLRDFGGAGELNADFDPLSGETDSSPWNQFRQEEELRGEILQDVVRCMPDNLYFRQPETQRTLTDILFIFCKLNPDIGYRQGMHELLAPILWVVERDAIDLGRSSKALGEDAVLKAFFDADHIEHDAFALFAQVMQSAKGFYEQTTLHGKENPIVARSKRIFGELLPQVDEKLARHLERIDIVPQVFLIKWVRLLFGREFGFDETLCLWDIIFAEDPSLEIVDYICMAMLLRIRWDLIDADYNVALTMLLRYPEPDAQLPPQTFALDGLYLREHMDRYSGSWLVAKYTGRPLELAGRPVTPPALQRNITTFSGQNAVKAASGSPSLPPSQPAGPRRNLEAALSSTARNIYARGERLGINKVVRNAVDEVQKKAQEIRETQTPSTPPSRARRSLTSNSLHDRVAALEQRSKQLAKLLDSAVQELWQYQKTASDTAAQDASRQTAGLEQLSVAIAKVQFIQVYMADPRLSLPAQSDDTNASENGAPPRPSSAVSGPTVAHTPEATTKDAALGTEQEVDIQAEAVSAAVQLPNDATATQDSASHLHDVVVKAENPEITVSLSDDKPVSHNATQISTASSRPSLEQSSFSWMLDRETHADDASAGSKAAASSESKRSKSSLFGAQDTQAGATVRRIRPKGGGRAVVEQPEDLFDIGTLKHSRKTGQDLH